MKKRKVRKEGGKMRRQGEGKLNRGDMRNRGKEETKRKGGRGANKEG